jgi:peptide deformylase
MIQLFSWPHEILNAVSSTWTKDDSINGYNDIEQFENDMIKFMLENKGMGLAANQIGITKRFFAIGSETFDKFKKSAIIWNPRLITQSEEKVIHASL